MRKFVKLLVFFTFYSLTGVATTALLKITLCNRSLPRFKVSGDEKE